MTPDQGHALYAGEQRCHGHALRMARRRREVKLAEKRQVKEDILQEKKLRERSSIPPEHLSPVSPEDSFDFNIHVDPDCRGGTSSQGLDSSDQGIGGNHYTAPDPSTDSGGRPLAGSISGSAHTSRTWRQFITTPFKRKPSTTTSGSTVLGLPSPSSSSIWTSDTVRPIFPISDPPPLLDLDVKKRLRYGGWLHALGEDKKGKEKKHQLQPLTIESLEPIDDDIHHEYSRYSDYVDCSTIEGSLDENPRESNVGGQSGAEDPKRTSKLRRFRFLMAKRTAKTPLNKGKGRAAEYDYESDEGSTHSHSPWDDGCFDGNSPARVDLDPRYKRQTECCVGVTSPKQQTRTLHRLFTQGSFTSTTTRRPFPSIGLVLESQNLQDQQEQQEQHVRSLLVERQEEQLREEAEIRRLQLHGERTPIIEYVEYLENEPTKVMDSHQQVDFDENRQHLAARSLTETDEV